MRGMSFCENWDKHKTSLPSNCFWRTFFGFQSCTKLFFIFYLDSFPKLEAIAYIEILSISIYLSVLNSFSPLSKTFFLLQFPFSIFLIYLFFGSSISKQLSNTKLFIYLFILFYLTKYKRCYDSKFSYL